MSTALLHPEHLLAHTPLAAASETEAARPSRKRSIPKTGVAAVLLVGLFAGCFVLYSRHNDFPISYHEDEPTKAQQVVSNTRNFNHPQLLLEATQIATALLRTPPQLQPTVKVGRDMSAMFGALAVVALAAAGYRLYGLTGLCLVGLATGLCPALLAWSHHMKEDAALTFGICMTVLATVVFWQRRRRRLDVAGALFLGTACGLAASGKYSGMFAIAAVIPLIVLAARPGWTVAIIRIVIVLAGFVAVFALVNRRVIGHIPWAWQSFKSECAHAAHGHFGLTMARPTTYHLTAFVRQCMPHVLIIASIYAAWVLARPRRDFWGLFLIAFAGGYLALISWSVIPFYRYVLPVVVLAHLMMALALVRFTRLYRGRWLGAALPALAGIALIALQFPRCLDYSNQFAHDSRERLREWVLGNLPADAVFVQDQYVGLDDSFDPRLGTRPRPELRIYGSDSAPDAGSPARLREIGVDYVAVADIEYDRYLNPAMAPAPDALKDFEYRRHWYQELFANFDLVWRYAPLHPTFCQYNNPEIRLYRLKPQ